LGAEVVDFFKKGGKDGMVVVFSAASIRCLNENKNEVGMIDSRFQVGRRFEMGGVLKEFVIVWFGKFRGFCVELVYILRRNIYTENIVVGFF
jgi:hypothetical protein